MEYITVKEAAEKWSMSTRRVQILCAEGRVEGVTRFGNRLMIPADAAHPTRREANAEEDMPLPRKTPFLYMSDLYSVPGSAAEASAALSYNPEAQILFDAEVAYSRGEIDRVYESANYLLNKHSGFYAVISGGTLLALCAIWKGDLEMWRRAKIHISEANARSEEDREIIALAITAVDSMLYHAYGFPEWFKIGCFEPLHKDALPAAKVYYAKYLYAAAYAVATGETVLKGVSGLALMEMLPCTIEPMISQAVADRTVISEIYLRLTCAVIYHYGKNDVQAIRHIDRAISLALADRLYGLLAEYCRTIGALLEKRLGATDPEAWQRVQALFRIYAEGWARLNSQISGRQIISKLSDQNRRVARLAAFKLSDKEIAERMNMSLSGVKQAIRIVCERSGLSRSEFAAIL